MVKKFSVTFLFVFIIFLGLFVFHHFTRTTTTTKKSNLVVPIKNNINATDSSSFVASNERPIYILKDVGEAYLDHFGLVEKDFNTIANAGFNIIEGNFDICASDDDVSYFLNTAKKYGLKVIMPAGSGEAEWGYECDEQYPANQKPVWQKKLVENWVSKWISYENIYAWDISNEAGSVMPNSEMGYLLTSDQLSTAYKDVKKIDSNRPVMIRMNGWYFYDNDTNFFRTGNPYCKGCADIVMVNAYSNVEDYYSDFVITVSQRSYQAIHEVDGNAKVIISLGVWKEEPLWYLPSLDELKNDFDSAIRIKPLGVAFFKYGADESEWYLPDHSDIWQEIVGLIE